MVKLSSFSQLIILLSLITFSNNNIKNTDNQFQINKEQSSKKNKYYIYPIILIILYYIISKLKKPESQKNIIRYGDEFPRIYNKDDEIRGEYSKFISKKRRKIKTPKSLVNEEGKIIFGTFDKEFEVMDLLKAKNPTRFPNFLNKYKLTLWEVCEAHLKNGVLLTVCCDMGIFGKQITMFYDKRTKKTYCWDTQDKSSLANVSSNLLNGSISEIKTKVGFMKYINNFEIGKCELLGNHKGKCLINENNLEINADNINKNYKESTIEYNFKMDRISKPSIVSIPFPNSNNRTLYTQKDFFKIKGKLIINGEEMLTDEDSTAIIDDHKGFYPRKAFYDWVTTLGKYEINGKKQFFAFNLTHNQSTDEESFNENIIFFENKTSILPPVKFERSVPCNKFCNYSEWTVKDNFDMVNLKFKVYGINPMITHAFIINIDYYVAWGVLEGYLRDEEGNKIVLDGMMGMGEDKRLLI